MTGTIYESFARVAASQPGRPALMHRVEGRYRSICYSELARAVDEVAAGLARRGVRPGDSVGIYSYNRPEWVIADLAIIKLGGTVIPIYHTLPPDTVEYILRDARVGHLIVETPELFGSVTGLLERVPDLKNVITVFQRETVSRSGKELLTSRHCGPPAPTPCPRAIGWPRPTRPTPTMS